MQQMPCLLWVFWFLCGHAGVVAIFDPLPNYYPSRWNRYIRTPPPHLTLPIEGVIIYQGSELGTTQANAITCVCVCVCVCVWESEREREKGSHHSRVSFLNRGLCANTYKHHHSHTSTHHVSVTQLCSYFRLELMVKLRTLLTAFTFILQAEAHDYGKRHYISDSC